MTRKRVAANEGRPTSPVSKLRLIAFLTALLIVLRAVVAIPYPAWALSHSDQQQGDVVVGDSKDGCARDNPVTLQGRSGTVTVLADQSLRVELPADVNELRWYCGGSRERVANDTAFNVLHITRASNGAISWTFYQGKPTQPGGTTPPQLARVGDSRDGCDGMNDVTVTGKGGAQHHIAANTTALFELDGYVTSFRWLCGGSSERVAVANDIEFNWVQVERAGNGAIQWVFYRSGPGPSQIVNNPTNGDYIHNATGVMKVGVLLPEGTREVSLARPLSLKTMLDMTWVAARKELIPMISAQIASDPDVSKFYSLQLSETDPTELRIRRGTSGIDLKYVVHGNTTKVTVRAPAPAPDVTVNVTFDLEFAVGLGGSGNLESPLKVTRIAGAVRRADVDGDGPYSNFATSVVPALVRRGQQKVSSIYQDFSSQANNWLANAFAVSGIGTAIPANFVNIQTTVSPNGTIAVCFKSTSQGRCTFAPTAGGPPPRVALDSTGGGCGENMIWVWDAEKGRYISIGKGQANIVVEVESRRFSWYCGGDHVPNYSHDEWETGPRGTQAVAIARDSGRGIRWQFLDWRPTYPPDTAQDVGSTQSSVVGGNSVGSSHAGVSASSSSNCGGANYGLSQQIAQQLGCTSTGYVPSRAVVTQGFERGFMIIFTDDHNGWGEILPVYAFADDGRVWRVKRAWGQPSDVAANGNSASQYSCDRPNADIRPEQSGIPWRGFGKVWCEVSDIRQALGRVRPGAAEIPEAASFEQFQTGRALAFGGHTYVAFFSDAAKVASTDNDLLGRWLKFN